MGKESKKVQPTTYRLAKIFIMNHINFIPRYTVSDFGAMSYSILAAQCLATNCVLFLFLIVYVFVLSTLILTEDNCIYYFVYSHSLLLAVQVHWHPS